MLSFLDRLKQTIDQDKITVLPGKCQVLWSHPDKETNQVLIARRTTSETLVLIAKINGCTTTSKALARLTSDHGNISGLRSVWRLLDYEAKRHYTEWIKTVKAKSF